MHYLEWSSYQYAVHIKMNWQPSNPVERRLMAAHEDWLSFAKDKQARLLYWHANSADIELINVYFQGQRELSNAVLCFNASFEDDRQYPIALAAHLIEFYEERKKGASEIAATWVPSSRGKQPETHYLLTLLMSLMQHHPDVFPGIVLVLRPDKVSKADRYERWLSKLLEALDEREALSALASRIRFVLYGSHEEPLAWLAAKRPDHVHVVRGQYRMQALPREMIAQSSERGSSGQFRRLLAELGECVSHDDPARLERLRKAALEVSNAEQWHDQSTTVHLLAGAAYLKWKLPDEALAAYREAEHAGRRALSSGHEVGNQLTINGLFGAAAVHLTERRYLDAARCYGDALPLALAANDSVLSVEAARMEAVCLDMGRRREEAIDVGFLALKLGDAIDPALRSNSNLQLVVPWMLSRIGRFHRRRDELECQFEALYGVQWREAIVPLPPEQVSEQLIAAEGAEENKNGSSGQ